MLEPSAACGLHPSVTAVALCKRCGTFCCADCLEVPTSLGICINCSGYAAPGKQVSWRGAAAVLVAFLGLSCAPLSLVGAGLAVWAWQHESLRTRPGRGLPLLAFALALVGLAVGVLVVLRYREVGLPGALEEWFRSG